MLHLLGVTVPPDVDGRILMELLEQEPAVASPLPILAPVLAGANGDRSLPDDTHYTAEEDAAIKQRLADLGYL